MAKNGYYGNGVLFFACDLGVIFLGIHNFEKFKILKNVFKKIQILGYHRKMYRLVRCMRILRGFFN